MVVMRRYCESAGMAINAARSPGDQPWRRVADVDVRARGRARHLSPHADERDARLPQVLHQPAALRAVRVHRHVDVRPVIEPESIVDLRLAEGADRQAPAEGLVEALLKRRHVLERPGGGAG